MSHQQKTAATAWARFHDVNEVRPIDQHDHSVLMELRDVLLKHDAMSRFGVTLVHRHFDLQEGEVVVESTDIPNRRQTIEVKAALEVLGRGRILETQWVFDSGSPNLICVGYCHYASGHKHYHSVK